MLVEIPIVTMMTRVGWGSKENNRVDLCVDARAQNSLMLTFFHANVF